MKTCWGVWRRENRIKQAGAHRWPQIDFDQGTKTTYHAELLSTRTVLKNLIAKVTTSPAEGPLHVRVLPNQRHDRLDRDNHYWILTLPSSLITMDSQWYTSFPFTFRNSLKERKVGFHHTIVLPELMKILKKWLWLIQHFSPKKEMTSMPEDGIHPVSHPKNGIVDQCLLGPFPGIPYPKGYGRNFHVKHPASFSQQTV